MSNYRRLLRRNREIDELCEKLIKEYEGEGYDEKPVDIIGFVKNFLGLKLLIADFAEDNMNKIGFLANGTDPLKIQHNGKVTEHIFPEKTIVIDRCLTQAHYRSKMMFTIAHEAYHYIDGLMSSSPAVSAFHQEFDEEYSYSVDELHRFMSIWECQADRGAAALLMPRKLIMNLYDEFTNGECITVYGDNIMTENSREMIRSMAEYLGVSFTALFIRLKHLNLLEFEDFSKFVSDELHLPKGGSSGYDG